MRSTNLPMSCVEIGLALEKDFHESLTELLENAMVAELRVAD